MAFTCEEVIADGSLMDPIVSVMCLDEVSFDPYQVDPVEGI